MLDGILEDKTTKIRREAQRREWQVMKEKQDELASEVLSGVPDGAKKVVEWQAPARLYLKRKSRSWVILGVFWVILSLVLWNNAGFAVGGMVMALGFLGFVYFGLEPPMVEYALTNQGVWADRLFYPWKLLKGYSVRSWGDLRMIRIVTPLPQGKVILILNKKHLNEVEYSLKKVMMKW
jgi:hypothetical protein